MVREGIPFRTAYREVAKKAGSGSFPVPAREEYTHTGSIGNTGADLIRIRLDGLMGSFSPGSSPRELCDAIMQ